MKQTMRKYDFYYKSQRKTCTKYVTLLVLTTFCLAVTTFALLEVSNFYSDEPTVARILLNSFRTSTEMESYNSESKNFALVNLEQQMQQDKKQEWNAERQARAANNNNTNSPVKKSSSYYEEQAPVVVYSKTDIDSSIARMQMAEVPPKQDADDDDPYSSAFEDDYPARDDNDYVGQQVEAEHRPYDYYNKQQQQLPQPYYGHQPSVSPQYYDGSREDYSSPESQPTSSEEARSSQYHDYGNHYGQYPSPPQPVAGGRPSAAYSNRQVPLRKVQPQYREPFPTYMDDYEYLPTQSHAAATQRPAYANRKTDQQMPEFRTPNSPPPSKEIPESTEQMDFLTMFKSLKTMWDLYQSFTSSWNTLAARRNREEEIAKQKYKQQQQIRINSRKPPKFNASKNATITNKHPRRQTTTTSTTAMVPVSDTFTSDEEKEEQPAAKVEPHKSPRGAKTKNNDVESSRDKRQAAVAEPRYIKGDPLKGYYDFVITEGSYKFWAAFQVGTAILIIYSTFAAIYYSKVNPLVSDYDYTDYLGGARSLSGGDLDFVDDDASSVVKDHTKGWLEWLPRTSHSLKFVLDAIDKLPTDHAGQQSDKEINRRDSSEEVNADETVYTDDAQTVAQTETSNLYSDTKENEALHETENLSDTQRTNSAM